VPGVITAAYGETYEDRSALMESFIDEVESALSGLTVPGLPPMLPDPCVAFPVDDFVDTSGASAEAFRNGIEYGRQVNEDGLSDFEKVFLKELYNNTLNAIDQIPIGPTIAPADPTGAIPTDKIPIEAECPDLPALVGCIVETLLPAGSECLCDYIGEPNNTQKQAMEDAGHDDFCEFAIELLLAIELPSISIDIPLPPEIAFDIGFDFNIVWEWSFPAIAIEIITIVIEWILTLPTIAIDLANCFLDAGLDPCEMVNCITEELIAAVDTGLAEAGIDLSKYQAWMVAFAVYISKISGALLISILGLAFGWGLIGQCAAEALGIL
jgi:hypothetical protein